MAETASPTELEPTAGEKRTSSQLVDTDDNASIASSKKVRIDPDKAKQVKCLKFIIELYKKLRARNPNVDKDMANITYANQLVKIGLRVFLIRTQRNHGYTGKYFTITSGRVTYTISIENAILDCEAAAKDAGLQFVSQEYYWYSTANTYFQIFYGHCLRLQEIRLGRTNMPIGREGKRVPVSRYGLDERHHVLLEGISYSPKMRSEMKDSLGPMTTLLCHIISEDQYRSKWTAVTKRALAHIPYIGETLQNVKGKCAGEVCTLIQQVANITLLAGYRQDNRMFFPINFLARVIEKKIEILTPEGIEVDELLAGFNVSGTGGFYLYKLASKLKWTIEESLNENEAAKLTFHSIFGTYKQDSNILEQMTGLGTWDNREELGSCFEERKTEAVESQFNLIPLRAYSMPSANQTYFSSSQNTQICYVPVFSGRRIHHFSEAFLRRFNLISNVAKTIPQLISLYHKVFSKLRNNLEGNDMKIPLGMNRDCMSELLSLRHAVWHDVETLTLTEHGIQLNAPIVESKKIVFGRRC